MNTFETLQLVTVPGDDHPAVLDTYRRFLSIQVPGFVIEGVDLETVDAIVVEAGLVERAGTFGLDNLPHVNVEREFDVGSAVSRYHVDGLIAPGPAWIHHHRTTIGRHTLTLASFAAAHVAAGSPPIFYGANDNFTATNRFLERTMRAGAYDPAVVDGNVYRGEVDGSSVVVLRIQGASPAIHDFATVHDCGPRGAVIRGYRQILDLPNSQQA